MALIEELNCGTFPIARRQIKLVESASISRKQLNHLLVVVFRSTLERSIVTSALCIDVGSASSTSFTTCS
jgi:hypothetical protein